MDESLENTEQSIGLSELIEKVKADLLMPPKTETPPILYVESIDLELQVVFKKDGNTGVKVNVMGFGGTVGSDIGHQNTQKIKVTLSSLISKEEVREYYKISSIVNEETLERCKEVSNEIQELRRMGINVNELLPLGNSCVDSFSIKDEVKDFFRTKDDRSRMIHSAGSPPD